MIKRKTRTIDGFSMSSMTDIIFLLLIFFINWGIQSNRLRELKEEFAGISSEEKISYVTDFLKENNLDAYLFCECDSVSWLMNLRSDLIKHSPVLRAYALVHSNGEVSLFTNNFEKLFVSVI